jgi:3-deoxy-manno-octulosonate cytidylyltransferase (CMP-KDO synthetase)
MAAVQAFGGQVLMTTAKHPSGTDGLTEVMQALKADIYTNLQCDEPLVRPDDISKLAQGMLADSSVQIGTLCHRLPASKADNPHLVKVVVSATGDALYFSHSPYPIINSLLFKTCRNNAYRLEVLEVYAGLPPLMMELAEKLKQLRLLSARFRIRIFEVSTVGPGVDTLQYLATVRELMKDRQI